MINIYKQKLTNLQQGILRLLFVKAGKQFNQRVIANILEVSPPAVMKALPFLEKQGLIKIQQDKESKRWSIELNRNNKAMQLKRADNFKLVYESGLADFLEEKFPGCTIILFGSYSKGEDISTSDIDIAVIGRKEKHVEFSKFEKLLERKIILNFYENIREINKNLRSNILNGIILSGGIEI